MMSGTLSRLKTLLFELFAHSTLPHFHQSVKIYNTVKSQSKRQTDWKKMQIHSLGPLSYARFSQKSKPKLHACLRKTVANFA